MDVVEVRVDPTDAGRERLGAFLATHLECERATLRRVRRVHVTALLGVPLAVCALMPLPRPVQSSILAAFGVSACVTASALLGELRCRRRLHEAERGVRVAGPSKRAP